MEKQEQNQDSKQTKKQKFFVHITSNIVLFAAIVTLSVIGFSAKTATVSSSNDVAIYQGNTKNAKISLMINVYWGTEYINGILDALEAAQAKCTFFVGGTWIEQNKSMLEKIISKGHEIGNHGYTHKDHDKLSAAQNKDEIELTHRLVKALTGIEMNLFAPPSGAYSKTTLTVASNLGYKTIMWSEQKDTIDWRDKNANLIYSRATTNLKNGDLILMHPTEKTVEALPRILSYAKSNNFKVTTVSDCLL